MREKCCGTCRRKNTEGKQTRSRRKSAVLRVRGLKDRHVGERKVLRYVSIQISEEKTDTWQKKKYRATCRVVGRIVISGKRRKNMVIFKAIGRRKLGTKCRFIKIYGCETVIHASGSETREGTK